MYKALRSMTVKGADGQYRMVQPGDPVPEAAGWKNLKSYLRQKRVCLATDPAPAPKKAPAKKAAPKMSAPLPPPLPLPAPAPEASEDAKYTKSVLSDMATTDLRKLAEGLGIDPDLKKSSLVKAILKAQ